MISAELKIIRSLVRPILEKPFADNRQWQVQGLGMVRTYLDKNTRLHLWSRDVRFCEDSGWHTHPWDFASFIVAGTIRNHLHLERAESELYNVKDVTNWKPFDKQHIICGPGGCAISEPVPVRLWNITTRTYYAGDHYQQSADEIHTTEPADGTISIIARKTVHEDGSANIYYPRGSAWTSAEARGADFDEIVKGTQLALNRLRAEEENQ